jgi:hypothetical protein
MVIMVMIIMLIKSDHVSELWPPTDLLFIPQVIYEHGEPWLNDDVDRKLLIHPKSVNLASRVIW